MSGRLAGRRILITGATSGVGLAAVQRFADESAALALVARGTPALLEAAAVAHQRGAVAHVFPADLTDRAATTAAVEAAAEALGGLDAVVSNAGALAFGHLLEVDGEDFDRALAVTFTGAVNVIRAMYVLEVDANAKPQLLPGQDASRNCGSPNWSSDGKTIIFVSEPN